MATDTTTTTAAADAAPAAGPAAPTAPAAPAAPTAPPSVHVRAVITWLAIFPLVAIGMMLMAPFVESWHPVLRAFVLTLVVVPLAVYLVVPRFMRAYFGLRRRAPRSGVDA
jgi:antibiotic biosynthesis monooxygenase (ABM) superfamily enzyme